MTREVVIVGGGPVGLVLAAELRACDVDVLVVERETSADTRLRAPAITERTIEALERHGLLERIAGEAQRYRAAHGATSATLPTDLRIDGVRALPVRQDLVERVLDEHVRARGGEVRRGCELVGLTPLGDGVQLRIRGAAAGSVAATTADEEVLHARYVVGCDGGHSTVRSAAGIGFEGRPATLTGYQAQVELEDPGVLPRGWQRTPTGIAAYELCPSRIVSIEFTGPPADRSAPVTLEEVQASLRRTSATDVTLTGARSLTRFTDSARLAESYRRGRVLLAGDAAHVHAPFGGQGLNLGVQDAVNLGWKLAATVRGWAPAGLLDSYEHERRPVAEAVLRNVRTAVTLMDPDPRMTPVHELVAELRGLEAVRRHMHEKTAMTDLRYAVDGVDGDHPHLLGRVPRGLRLSVANTVVELAQVARAGRGLLLVLSDAGRRAADVAGSWSDRVDVVVATAASAPDGVRDALSADALAALLMRPDGHVIWMADRDGHEHPAALRRALWRAFGRPAARGTTSNERQVEMITDDEIRVLQEDGYLLATDLLSPEEVASCRRELRDHFPTCDELLAHPDRFATLGRAAFFPYSGPTLNRASTHPVLIDLVERVLGTGDVRIGDAVLQAKYGTLAGGGRDQTLHHDSWEGGSLIYPAEAGLFQRVFAIVYLTDVSEDLAPTYVVPRSVAGDLPLVTEDGLASYSRDAYPWLYEAERPIEARAGSALITMGRTIHRGSAMRAEHGDRFALFASFHAAAATWQRSRTFVSLPGAPEGPAARQFMAESTPKQRQLFGFPAPGHAYWTDETIRGIAGIYPDMDLTPYACSLRAPAGAGGDASPRRG